MSHHRPPPPPWTFLGSFHPRNVLFAGIGAAIVLYFTDALIFGGLFGDYFDVPGMRKEPLLICSIAGYTLGGLLFSGAYAFYAWPNKIIDSVKEGGPGHRSKTMRGMLFGAIVAALIFLPTAFIYHSLFEGWTLKIGLIEAVYHMIQFAIAGIVVAHLLTDSDSVEGTTRKPIEFK